MLLTIGEIIKRFRTEGQCYKFKPQTILYMANRLGYTKKRNGGKIGYDQSLITAITRHFNDAMEYDKGLGVKTSQKPLKQPNIGGYYTYNGERDNIDYDWEKNEGIIRRAILESIDELDLYHGSPHDFEQFDFAYMYSGWGGQNAYGYGAYLTTNYECAKEYSQGHNIYTVEIPDKGYLNFDKVSSSLAMKIARIFFKYYTTEDEYGKEMYSGCEDEFWENECKCIGNCYDGGCLYGTISSFLGSDKRASEFFHNKLGYKGIVYVATNGVTGKKFKNYVIFDTNDIKILKKEKLA